MNDKTISYLERVRLTAPQQPIAIRKEHLTPSRTIINIKQRDNSWLGRNFTIRDAYAGSTLFTVEGKSFSNSQRREFRDASGLPLFELRRRYFTLTYSWELILPGGRRFGGSSDEDKILSSRLRWSWWTRDKLDVTLRAVAAASQRRQQHETRSENPENEDAKETEDVTLQVRGQGPWHITTHVIVGGRKVAHICRIISPDLQLSTASYSQPGHRLEWDAAVAEGVDLALVSLSTLSGCTNVRRKQELLAEPTGLLLGRSYRCHAV